MKKENNVMLIISALLLIIIALVIVGLSSQPREIDNSNDMIACTMDAKQCPDGSYVGRVPPDCDFAPCPGE